MAARSYLLYNFPIYIYIHKTGREKHKEVFCLIVLSLRDCAYSHVRMFPKAADKTMLISSVILVL